MWELHNMLLGWLCIIKCVQNDNELDRETRDYVINLVLSNLIVFSKYKVEEDI